MSASVDLPSKAFSMSRDAGIVAFVRSGTTHEITSQCVERLSELHMGTRPRPSLSIVGVNHNRSLMKVVELLSDLCSFEHRGQCCPFLFMRNSVLVVIKRLCSIKKANPMTIY